MPWDTKWDPKLPETVKNGIDYLDAAWSYTGGNNELAIGSFLERTKMRDKLWITSKSNVWDPDGFEGRLNESLSRMKTSYVNMYFLHGLNDPKALDKPLLAKVEKLKKEQKLRHFGFSCHDDNVIDLLKLAAQTPWVEAVMFRYNFRQYGNKELNQAMDACHKAGVGLIAMKTQGSAVSFEQQWQKFQQTGKWNKYQAVLKAVWADERISATVSEMDSLEKIRENLCQGAIDAPIPIATTLRFLMYHDSYGKRDAARALYQALPEAARRIEGVDFARASAACPHGLDVDQHLKRASQVLA
jgi:predicted aldo/keto reductase-like oxidoreductase